MISFSNVGTFTGMPTTAKRQTKKNLKKRHKSAQETAVNPSAPDAAVQASVNKSTVVPAAEAKVKSPLVNVLEKNLTEFINSSDKHDRVPSDRFRGM